MIKIENMRIIKHTPKVQRSCFSLNGSRLPMLWSHLEQEAADGFDYKNNVGILYVPDRSEH